MSFHRLSQPTSSPQDSAQGEKGYSWLFLASGRPWARALRLLLLVLVLGGSIAFFVWYNRVGNDAAPDSLVGYSYALVGTLFLLLAGTLYSLRRRSRKRAVGQLNAALNWHVFFAIIGFVLLFMHSFGNFNPRSGTFALYGLVALVVSGFIGRLLDRVMPRLIAGEVRKALTGHGEDRIDSISQKLQAIVLHNTEEVGGFAMDAVDTQQGGRALPSVTSTNVPLTIENEGDGQIAAAHMPWDLAYISLEATPQELQRESRQHRFVPDKQSALARPGALLPGAQEQMSALHEVQRAMQREQFYRHMIRYWRVVHIALALLTLGLVIWHIVYALQLLLPTLLH